MNSIDNTTLQVLANYCARRRREHGLDAHAHRPLDLRQGDRGLLLPGADAGGPDRRLAEDLRRDLVHRPRLRAASSALFEDYEEGDICLTIDPYSGFVATHAPDIHMWKPVFRDGELICFVGDHIHNTDVGGAVPASLVAHA